MRCKPSLASVLGRGLFCQTCILFPPRRFPQRSCLPTASADMSKRPAPSPAAFIPSLPRDADSYAGSFQLHINVASRHLTQKRHVIVYLPPGHGADPAVRYPVLYMHDGQNLFDGDTAYIRGHDWKMARTAERLMLEKKIEPLIIVGIWNTGVHRMDEYTPTRDPGVKQGGLLPMYGRFIVEELKPFVDATYCTDPARDRTGIGGSSLGLAALLLGLHYSEYFGRIAALSPSLWWDHGVAFRLVRHLKRKPDVRIWLDMGTREMAALRRCGACAICSSNTAGCPTKTCSTVRCGGKAHRRRLGKARRHGPAPALPGQNSPHPQAPADRSGRKLRKAPAGRSAFEQVPNLGQQFFLIGRLRRGRRRSRRWLPQAVDSLDDEKDGSSNDEKLKDDLKKLPYRIAMTGSPALAASLRTIPASERLTPLVSRLMGGRMMSSTKDDTILPKAPPMTTPMARSMTLPREMKVLNS